MVLHVLGPVLVATMFVAAGAILTVGLMLLRLWSLVRRLQGLPLNVRINPINILAYRRYWTPEIEQLNKRLNVAGCVLIVCTLIVLMLGLSTP